MSLEFGSRMCFEKMLAHGWSTLHAFKPMRTLTLVLARGTVTTLQKDLETLKVKRHARLRQRLPMLDAFRELRKFSEAVNDIIG